MESGGNNASIADAVTAWAEAVTTLQQISLTPCTDGDIIELLQNIETITRRAATIGHRLLTEARERCLPARLGLRSLPVLLEQTLRLGHAEAVSRCTAAELCGMRQSGGEELEPLLPTVAAGQTAGLISPESVRVIAKIMKRIPAGVNSEGRASAEEVLAEFACTSTPDDLPKVGERIIAHLDPDGRLTDDKDRARMRGFTVGKQRADGMTPGSFELTPEAMALLSPVLDKFARPGMCNPEDPESPWVDDGHLERGVLDAAAKRDNRTCAQRNHDALVAFLRPELGPANLGKHRGLPVSTILTMSLAEVEAAAGVATTHSGGTVPLSAALRLAQKAEPFLAVFDHAGMPLHLGRMKRLASPAQRMALIAAERGCSRPGCNAPAAVSAVHHVTEWSKGGRTNIRNLTLACDACHALIHDGPGDWKTVKLGPGSKYPGRTGWIAPPHIDPTGTPRVNLRHHVGDLMAESLARSRSRYRRPCRPTLR